MIYVEILSTTTIFNRPENVGEANNATNEADDDKIKPSITRDPSCDF